MRKRIVEFESLEKEVFSHERCSQGSAIGSILESVLGQFWGLLGCLLVVFYGSAWCLFGGFLWVSKECLGLFRAHRDDLGKILGHPLK